MLLSRLTKPSAVVFAAFLCALATSQTTPPPTLATGAAPPPVVPAVTLPAPTTRTTVPPPPVTPPAATQADSTKQSSQITDTSDRKPAPAPLGRAVIDPNKVGYPIAQGRAALSPSLPTAASTGQVPPVRGAQNSVPAATVAAPTPSASSLIQGTGGHHADTVDGSVNLPGFPTFADSPQTRALPGLGRAPGTVDSGKPQIVRMTNGVNHLVRLAQGFPNRIVVPFKKPRVVDDGIEHLIVGNSVYVRLNQDTSKGTIFIHDDSDPTAAVATITFVGANIPAQTIMVQFDSQVGVEETPASDYLSGLKTLLRTVVRGGDPQGYTVEPLTVPMASAAVGLEIQPDRRWAGSRMEVLRYRIRNSSTQSITLSEEMFGSQSVRAVAFFPSVQVTAGATTLVFIVNSLGEEGQAWQAR